MSALALVGGVEYETTLVGEFCNPTDALAAFFLGPKATATDLADHRITEYYCVEGQRDAFIERLKRKSNVPLTDVVLLALPQGKTWCRFRSVHVPDDRGDRCIGLVLAMSPGDDWEPGRWLTSFGVAYVRINVDGKILFASQAAALWLGVDNSIDLIKGSFHERYMEPGADGATWIAHAWQKARGTHPEPARLTSHLLAADGAVRPAEVTAFLHDPEASVLELGWRDLSDEAARTAALDLREGVNRIEVFEQAVIHAAARIGGFSLGAFYSYHPKENCYVLRSTIGLPPTTSLPATFPVPLPEEERSLKLARFQRGEREWQHEKIYPVHHPEGDLLGCFWVPILDLKTGSAFQHFVRYLGIILRGAEEQIAQRAGDRALEEAVDILLGPEPTHYYRVFLDRVLNELSADSGSVFELERRDGVPLLVLRASTGIRDVDQTLWSSVTYALGSGLTGTMATRDHAASVLDLAAFRRVMGLPEARYVEEVDDEPLTWLGCPILVDNQIQAYVRAVNRRIEGRPQDVLGFSQGDALLLERLAAGASRFLVMREKLSYHQAVIAQSAHELLAPLVAIRTHAWYVGKHPDGLLVRQKADNIRADAELLLDLIHTIESVSQERPPRLQATNLYTDILVPLKFGLTKVATDRGYAGLDVRTDGLHLSKMLWIDRSMVRQVFYNLLVNAIKYGPEPLRFEGNLVVEIQGSIRHGECIVFVSDWGIGIADQYRDTIFELYFRAPEGVARAPTGSGIGLHVVRKLLAAHRGSVWLSRTSGPTIFELRFPAGGSPG